MEFRRTHRLKYNSRATTALLSRKVADSKSHVRRRRPDCRCKIETMPLLSDNGAPIIDIDAIAPHDIVPELAKRAMTGILGRSGSGAFAVAGNRHFADAELEAWR